MKRRALKLMVSAGDLSGDQHAAAVLRELKRRIPGLKAFGLGGPALAAAGMRLDVDLVSRSVIGLVEVIKGLAFYRRAMNMAVRSAAEESPDIVLLVDSSGFNLRLARRLTGRTLVYYICPQLWASRPGRLRGMAKSLSKALYTFPFEKKIYEGAGIPATFVGHPLMDAIPPALRQRGIADPSPARLRRLRSAAGFSTSGPLLGLLPGSRRQEIKALLVPMLETALLASGRLPKLRCVVIKAPDAPRSLFAAVEAFRRRGLKVDLFESRVAEHAYGARAACDAALVASGTATLETALLGVPFNILYRVHPLTYAIAKRMVTLPYIGLANVVAGSKVVPEFVQGDLRPEGMAASILPLLTDASKRLSQRAALAPGLKALGAAGVAKRVAGELAGIFRAPRA